MGYLELMLINSGTSVAVCDLVKPQDIVVKGLNEIEEMHDAEYYYNKGWEAEKQKQFTQAVNWFQKTLQVDPEHEAALHQLGYCYLSENGHCGYTLDLYGLDANTCSKRAVNCYEKLLGVIKAKREFGSSESVYFNNLGVAYGNLDETSKKKDAYLKAIQLDQTYYMPNYNMGTVCLFTGQLDEAEKYFNIAWTSNKDYLMTHYHFGLLYEEKKQYKTATKWFKSYLDNIDRTDPWEKEHIKYAVDAIDRMKNLIQ
jgi:tetratricopeptide (TPR) repeat protein